MRRIDLATITEHLTNSRFLCRVTNPLRVLKRGKSNKKPPNQGRTFTMHNGNDPIEIPSDAIVSEGKRPWLLLRVCRRLVSGVTGTNRRVRSGYRAVAARLNPVAFFLELISLAVVAAWVIWKASDVAKPLIALRYEDPAQQQQMLVAVIAITAITCALIELQLGKRLLGYRWREWTNPSSGWSVIAFLVVTAPLYGPYLYGARQYIATEGPQVKAVLMANVVEPFERWQGIADAAIDQDAIQNIAATRPELGDTDEQIAYSEVNRYLREEIQRTGAPRIAEAFRRITQYEQHLRNAYIRHGVPESLLAGLIYTESRGVANARSPMGALGLMQVMPMHARQGENLRDPKTNVARGVSILINELQAHNWDLPTALGYYNCSVKGNQYAAVLTASLDNSNFWVRRPHLPKETSDYVPRVLAAELLWQDWRRYGRVRTLKERENATEPPTRPMIGRVEWTPPPAPEVPVVESRPLLQPASFHPTPEAGRVHVIQSGQHAGTLVGKYGVNLSQLARANPWVEDWSHLEIGWRIVIPKTT